MTCRRRSGPEIASLVLLVLVLVLVFVFVFVFVLVRFLCLRQRWPAAMLAAAVAAAAAATTTFSPTRAASCARSCRRTRSSCTTCTRRRRGASTTPRRGASTRPLLLRSLPTWTSARGSAAAAAAAAAEQEQNKNKNKSVGAGAVTSLMLVGDLNALNAVSERDVALDVRWPGVGITRGLRPRLKLPVRSMSRLSRLLAPEHEEVPVCATSPSSLLVLVGRLFRFSDCTMEQPNGAVVGLASQRRPNGGRLTIPQKRQRLFTYMQAEGNKKFVAGNWTSGDGGDDRRRWLDANAARMAPTRSTVATTRRWAGTRPRFRLCHRTRFASLIEAGFIAQLASTISSAAPPFRDS